MGWAIVAIGAPARAGGGAFDVHGDHLYWGERVVTRGGFANDIEGRGSIADGPWFAYLERPGFVETSDIDEGLRLGRISFGPGRGSFAVARLTFEVPRLRTGMYTLRLCNSPCT